MGPFRSAYSDGLRHGSAPKDSGGSSGSRYIIRAPYVSRPQNVQSPQWQLELRIDG